MADPDPKETTLSTLHQDLREGFADVKATLVEGFRGLPTREQSQEIIRLLQERNRILRDQIKGLGRQD